MRNIGKQTAALVALLLAGCGAGPAAPGEIAQYMNQLPGWEQAHPLEVASPERIPGPETTETADVSDYLDPKSGERKAAQILCKKRTVSLRENNRDIVILNPTPGLIWPGALIQGKSRTGTSTELKQLIVDPADRTPITVYLPGITGSTSIRVENPSAADVSDARSDLIAAVNSDGIGDPSSITSEIKTYYSDSDFAFGQSFSGKFLNWTVNASASYSRRQTQNSVAVYFAENMYTIAVNPPSSPSAWFGPGFTKEKLDRKIALGEIGPDNLPLYVSSVTYGRIMMATFTASTDAQSLEVAIRARYDKLFTSATSTTTVASDKLVSESEKVWNFWGGDSAAASAAIRDGDWQAYFNSTAQLSHAVPISFTLSTLDGQLAQVTDATTFTIEECREITDAGYDFLPVEELAMSVPQPREVRTGDFNGDGRTDILFDHAPNGGGPHKLVVAYAQHDGGFEPVEYPDTMTPSSSAGTRPQLLIGDLDGDGTDDAIWFDPNVGDESDARFSSMLGSGFGLTKSGTSDWRAVRDHPFGLVSSIGWPHWRADNYAMVLGEFDPDSPGVEVAISCFASESTLNRLYRLDFVDADSDFAPIQNNNNRDYWDHGGSWGNDTPVFRAIDLIDDGTDDLLYTGAFFGFVHVELTDRDGGYNDGHNDYGNPHNLQPNEKANFHVIARQRNGKEGLAWIDPGEMQPTVRFAETHIDGNEGRLSRKERKNMGEADFPVGVAHTSAVGYFDETNFADFLANSLGPDGNYIRIGYDYDQETGSFRRIHDARHPEDDPFWDAAKLFTGDIDKDGRTDLIWVLNNVAGAKVYVARKRQD